MDDRRHRLRCAAVLAVVLVTRASHRPELIRFAIPPPPGARSIGAPRVSPDGRTIAFNATDSTGVSRLWLRPIATLEPRALAGTDGAHRPFWSPDSRNLGFFAGGRLKKIEVASGNVQTVCDALGGADGSWSGEGMILFDGGFNDSLRIVPAGGGIPTAATSMDRGQRETFHAWPQFLPDDRHFLYLASGRQQEDTALKVGKLGSPEAKRFPGNYSRAEYAPPGYLLFVRERTLMAQRFDADSFRLEGEPFPIADPVDAGLDGHAFFSVSRNGVLAYQSGTAAGAERLVWVDRTGHEVGSVAGPADYAEPAISPDGRRVAVDIVDARSGTTDIWILDLARGVNSRFTFDPANDAAAVWSPDGSRVVFTSDRGGLLNLFIKPASGGGTDQPFLVNESAKIPCDWSSDGRLISFFAQDPKTGFDLWTVDSSGHEPRPFSSTPFPEAQPRFSPDGRCVAYTSAESGRPEIYVQSFPEGGGKWQVSTQGGVEPQWRRDGKELFYLSPDFRIWAVDVTTGPSFEASTPHPLFSVVLDPSFLTRNRYAAAPDGQRFLLLVPGNAAAIAKTTVVVNWTAGIEGR